jgi:phosphoribosylformylglycinamidine synthase II
LLSPIPRTGLSGEEAETVRSLLGREPTDTEWAIIDAEWAEHSSYKSSRALLRLFPTSGERVVLGPGYDAGVVDVGDGYVVTLHIESHNHPSAVDPYGGAATGIGGVLRDIISVGSRPIALVDVLRFGRPEQSAHSRWLFRNVVRGIADYGNCVGVPTVAGDIEFDRTFEKNCLVDVACIGVGRKGSVILGEAKRPGDIIVLIGGSTGRDGVGGAAFASKNLAKGPESERTSVQVPDPFMKKLLLDALLEVTATGLVHGMKDLGGGGLSTALSEITSKGGTGADVELSKVRARESDMTPREIMISESQERMLLVLGLERSDVVFRILDKYEVPHATIGWVTKTGSLKLRWNGRLVADLPAKVVAEAPLIPRSARKPRTAGTGRRPREDADIAGSLLSLLSSPNISSRRWVFEQYDHEVGLRTVLKPGSADASLLRLPNGSMLAVKADGNSRHSFLNPRRGGAGCVAEASRNVVAVGAEPLAVVDHLQFGDPSDEEVYWAFRETVEGMAEYCAALPLPVVGGKVSFYNEDASTKKAIKPSPVAMVVGLMPSSVGRVQTGFGAESESVFVIGTTAPELGGSEYYEEVLKAQAGEVPLPDARRDAVVYSAVRGLIGAGLASAVHDCSKGGLGVAIAEMCIQGARGAEVDLRRIPGGSLSSPEALFSETHGRFVASVKSAPKASAFLAKSKVAFALVGATGGNAIGFSRGGKKLASVRVDAAVDAWGTSLGRLME